MTDTYTTPFVFHTIPTDIFDIIKNFNIINFNPLDFDFTDTGNIVFNLTFKSLTDFDNFTKYYNGDTSLY